ncbi:MAG TPA: permease-like cell division protein FtsX [Cellvibrionaceae bacterium]
MKKQANPPSRKPARHQGARRHQTHWRDKLYAWQAHHSTTAVESLLRLLQTPLQSLMTWLVVAIATALPATLFVALQNIQSLGYQWQDSSQISVFARQEAAPEALVKWITNLNQRADISAVVFISPEEALEEFRSYSGLGRIVDDLDSNPLPAVLLVQPSVEASRGEALEQLRGELSGHPLADDVRLDMEWVERLEQIIVLTSRTVSFLAVLLALGLLLVIGNTIRMAIENRRDEIVVVKLVGGTNAYVRRPFLYTGLWYGLGGGLMALILLNLGLWWLAEPVSHLTELYQSDFRLQGLGAISSLQLVLVTGLLGLAGAALAVGRHLGQIEPR